MVSAVKQRVVSIVEKVKRVWQSRTAKLLRENKALRLSFDNAEVERQQNAEEVAKLKQRFDQVTIKLEATQRERNTLMEDNRKLYRRLSGVQETFEAQLATKANELEQAQNRVAWLEAELEALQERHGTVKQITKDRLAGIEKSVLDALNSVRQLDSELVV
jgi:chromosome segregation ATPase